MKKREVQQLSKILEGSALQMPLKNKTVSIACTDSRHVPAGFEEHCVFFAFNGVSTEGWRFVPELYQKGVRVFVLPKTHALHVADFPEACFLEVVSMFRALQALAKDLRKNELQKIPFCAITGSNGKTIVKDWLAFVLEPVLETYKSPKSYNSQLGVPLSILQCPEEVSLGIFEAGLSQKGEMAILHDLLQAEIGVFNYLSAAHGENFQNQEEKIDEKLKLFENAKIIVYPKHLQAVHERINYFYPHTKKIIWGYTSDCDIFVQNTQTAQTKTNITFQTAKNTASIDIPFTDKASLHNACTVLACCYALNHLEDAVLEKFSDLPVLPMRLELLEGKEHARIISDVYNSDIDALEMALSYLDGLPYAPKTLILSDFVANNNVALYQNTALLVQKYGITNLYAIGTALHAHKDLFCKVVKNCYFFTDTADFLRKYALFDFGRQNILVKGARMYQLEQVTEKLKQKHHQTWLEINLNALEQNLNYFKKRLPNSTKLMAMVKARAYGSSEAQTALFLAQKGVDYFGVAFSDEGVALRKEGVKEPIMVMQTVDWGICHEYQLEPAVGNFAQLQSLITYLHENRMENFSIHLEIDTGMHRLGFAPQELPAVLGFLAENKKYIKVAFMFSHLSSADDKNLDTYTQEQIALFENCAQQASETLNYPIQKHLLNSAGIQRFPSATYNMVRLGIGLYGIASETLQKQELKEVISFKTRIVHIQKLKKGEPIGYNRKTILQKDSKVATIPVGYADGFSRSLGNGNGSVWIHDKACAVLGNVCMDFTMIDISEVDAHLDDVVLLFGQGFSAEKMADKRSTIPYEIFTSIAGRVARIFTRE